jgi:hypothetical protein
MSEELERAAEELNNAIRTRDAGAAAVLLDEEFALTSSLGTGLHVDKAAWLKGLDAIQTDELGAGRSGAGLRRRRRRGVADGLAGARRRRRPQRYVVSDVWLRANGGWRLRWRSWARLNAEFHREELGA